MIRMELVNLMQADRERQIRDRLGRRHARAEHRPKPRINRRDDAR